MTVTCVNDAPNFSFDEKVYINVDDLGDLASEVIACNYDFGPDNEDSTQDISDFTVSILSDPQSILTSLDVLIDGNLNPVYSGNQGMAIINLEMQDDGGTSNGGINSQIHRVTIFVQDYIFKAGFESETCPE